MNPGIGNSTRENWRGTIISGRQVYPASTNSPPVGSVWVPRGGEYFGVG